MLDPLYLEYAGFFLIALSVAIAALWIVSVAEPRNRDRDIAALDGQDGRQVHFVFDGDALYEASLPAELMLNSAPTPPTDWIGVRAHLIPRFPTLPEDWRLVQEGISMGVHADEPADLGEITMTRKGNRLRMTLVEAQGSEPEHRLDLLERELQTLRQAAKGAPYPIWQTGAQGQLLWYNDAYRLLFARVTSGDKDPVKAGPLFDLDLEDSGRRMRLRNSLKSQVSDEVFWFDITSSRFDDVWMNYATDVNAVVSAEVAQRNFVQTLTKTFAQLSIGLAIFDRNRQLALFNPSLIDLTSLPADFLSARPNLLSFFDRLRDKHMMPEPKNYSSWREQIADLVAAATDGRYHETWTLPSGQTYRVTGRPHPDGAVAFLFEDISAEITLTRRFRSQIELGQTVIDKMGEAVAVFSPTGVLTLCNSAYRDMWGIDPENSFAEMTISDSISHWEEKCPAAPSWARARRFMTAFGERSAWKASEKTVNGTMLDCRFEPLSGGSTFVCFNHNPSGAPTGAKEAAAEAETAQS